MCGMTGWVSYQSNLEAQHDVITAMTSTMARRGPDAGGVWTDRHVAERTKSPYPMTQDPSYERAVRAQVADVMENRSHPAGPLLNRSAIEQLLRQPLGNSSSLVQRAGFERVRSISAWVKDHGIPFDL
jgi:asparagine synthetase B (glutamine-hydrolysing)